MPFVTIAVARRWLGTLGITKKAVQAMNLVPYFGLENLRVMLFVDGENLSIRFGAALKTNKFTAHADVIHRPDVYVWNRHLSGEVVVGGGIIRSHYYTAVQGDHPAVEELRQHSIWSEGQVWCSPERHGQITGIMKAQVDHLPLAYKGLRPTQGRTLAVMQVSAGSQSFNSVNTLRILGRWMRMITIPNQSSVAKAYQEFDESGRMLPSSYYDRIVDVAEELVRFTVLIRGHAEQLVDRYSERRESAVTPLELATLPRC